MLYVANATKQNWMLNVRIPESGKVTIIEIPSGQQREIAAGLSKASIDSIVGHLERFGARNNADSKLHIEDFDGYLYSLGKPVSSDKISDAHETLVEKQEKRSVNEAMRNAAAYEKSTRDKRSGKRLASLTEVEVVQDLPPREKATGKEVKFKVTVDEKGTDEVKL
jgi:hypothetical protein